MERWQCRSDAERAYCDEGINLFRCVNAMAMAAEQKGHGFAYYWPPAVPGFFDGWDDIAHVVLDATPVLDP